MSYKSDIGGDEVYDGDGVGNSDGDGDNDNDGDGDGDGDGEDNHLQIIRHALIAQKYEYVSGPGHPTQGTSSQYQISYIFRSWHWDECRNPLWDNAEKVEAK